MKKIIALSLCLILVLSLCACGAKEDLTGKWTTTINMAESYNAEMAAADPTMAEYMSLDSFNVPLVLELKADGTYTMTVEKEGLEAALSEVVGKLSSGMEAYFADLLAQQGIEMDVNEALAAMGISMDDLMAELTAELDADALYESMGGEGNWKAENGKFYMTEDLETAAGEGEYNTYVLEGDTLTLDVGTETVDEETAKLMFPMVLTRSK